MTGFQDIAVVVGVADSFRRREMGTISIKVMTRALLVVVCLALALATRQSAAGAAGVVTSFIGPVLPSQGAGSPPAALESVPFPKGDVALKLHCLSRGDPAKKLVALTFDDGPKPEYTLEILAALARYRVPATFFYVGSQCALYPDLVKATYMSGHEIGNHTYDHQRLPLLTTAQKTYEIDATQELIAQIIGVQPRFFRPPGGHRDSEVEDLLAKRDMLVGMWDLSLNDSAPNCNPSEILCAVQDQIRPGSVILAHSGVAATLEALPAIIHNLTARGYTFVTLSQLADGLSPKCAARGRGAAGLSNACFHERRTVPARRRRPRRVSPTAPSPEEHPAVPVTPPGLPPVSLAPGVPGDIE